MYAIIGRKQRANRVFENVKLCYVTGGPPFTKTAIPSENDDLHFLSFSFYSLHNPFPFSMIN